MSSQSTALGRKCAATWARQASRFVLRRCVADSPGDALPCPPLVEKLIAFALSRHYAVEVAAHTNAGRGVLLRLLIGEPLRALLLDDDLVLATGLAAPGIDPGPEEP